MYDICSCRIKNDFVMKNVKVKLWCFPVINCPKKIFENLNVLTLYIRFCFLWFIELNNIKNKNKIEGIQK